MTSASNKKTKEKAEKKLKLFNTITIGLKNGSITNMEDVVNIYKGISGLTSEDFSYRYGLSNYLREYLVNVVSKDKSLFDESISADKIVQWKNMISDFIKQNDTMSPFADLPSAERNILSDLITFLDKNEKQSAKHKISELAGTIQARNNESEKLKSINKWTLPLTIVGFILTVMFGILALSK
jgi:hypothetical protein